MDGFGIVHGGETKKRQRIHAILYLGFCNFETQNWNEEKSYWLDSFQNVKVSRAYSIALPSAEGRVSNAWKASINMKIQTQRHKSYFVPVTCKYIFRNRVRSSSTSRSHTMHRCRKTKILCWIPCRNDITVPVPAFSYLATPCGDTKFVMGWALRNEVKICVVDPGLWVWGMYLWLSLIEMCLKSRSVYLGPRIA